jgi:hypothetical protein
MKKQSLTLAAVLLMAMAGAHPAQALTPAGADTLVTTNGTARFGDPDDQMDALTGTDGQSAATVYSSGAGTMTFTQSLTDKNGCTGTAGCGCPACTGR